MIKKLIFRIPKLISQLKWDAYQADIPFPKLKLRLFAWAVYMQLIQQSLPEVAGQKNGLPIGALAKKQDAFDEAISKITMELVLLAYDEPVDQGFLNRGQVYDQLSRCLAGFMVEAYGQFPVPALYIKTQFQELREQIAFEIDDATCRELDQLLARNKFLSSLDLLGTVSPTDLFFVPADGVQLGSLNITIQASLALGRTYREFLEAFEDLFENRQACIEWHKGFVFMSLIKSGYAQANTVRQMNTSDLDLNKYVRIAQWKSSAFLDIGSSFRFMLNQGLFWKRRRGRVKFCEQVLDDLMDFYEDASAGILNFLSLYLIEQGRIAYKVHRLLSEFEINDPVFIEKLQMIFAGSRLLVIGYEGSYVFHNPYVQVERNATREVEFNNRTLERILKEAFVNSPLEMDMELASLLKLRMDAYDGFQRYWKKQAWKESGAILELTNIPIMFTQALMRFVRGKRAEVLLGNNKVAEYGFYYVILTVLHICLLKFKLNKSIILLGDRIQNTFVWMKGLIP